MTLVVDVILIRSSHAWMAALLLLRSNTADVSSSATSGCGYIMYMMVYRCFGVDDGAWRSLS